MAETFNCPSCGAPLEPEGDKTTIICKYCSESVIVPAELRTPSEAPHLHVSSFQQVERPVVYVSPDAEERLRSASHRVQAYQSAQAVAKRQSGCSLGVGLVIVIISIGIFALAGGVPLIIGLVSTVNSATGANVDLSPVSQTIDTIIKPDVRVMEPVVVVPMADTKSPNLLVPIDDNGTDTYQYVMLDGVKKTILWRSETVGKTWSDVKAFAYAKRVYVFNLTTLTALDIVTGKQVWKASFDNGLGYCKTCLLETGNAVVVMLKDGTVQAVDAASGKLTWHKTLNNTNADLFLADGKPAVEDKENDKPVLYIFDPPTGKIAQQLQPGCPAVKPKGYLDEIIPDADGKSAVLLYDGCVQRISLPDGKAISEVLAPADRFSNSAWPNAWFATKHFLTRNAIYYTDNGSQQALNTIDISKGNPRLLIQDKKYSLEPRLVIGDVLVVEAFPSFDSKQREYWGINTQTGQRMWQYALKGQGSLSYNSMQASSKGLFVVQCREDPGSCTWATVDPKTGVGSNTGTGPGGPFIDVNWGKDTLYLGADGPLMVIDTTTAKLLYQWP